MSDDCPSVDEFREHLTAETVRITFAPTFSFSAGMVETARVEVKQANGRWRKVSPLLLPREGGSRADLLADLAGIVRGPVLAGSDTEDREGQP